MRTKSTADLGEPSNLEGIYLICPTITKVRGDKEDQIQMYTAVVVFFFSFFYMLNSLVLLGLMIVLVDVFV